MNKEKDIINKVHCADCLGFMKTMPDNSVDLVLTDPPYGVTQNKEDIRVNLDELFRVGKSVIMTTQQPYTTEVISKYKKYFRYDLIWDKVLTSGFLNANRLPLRKHEIILVFNSPVYNPQFSEGIALHSKGSSYKEKEPKNLNYGKFKSIDDKRAGSTKKYPTSILKFDKPHPSIARHRTEKPVALMEYLIQTYSDEGDTILDPFLGSGTTAVACRNLHRNFIGIEISEEYCKIARDRLRQQTLI